MTDLASITKRVPLDSIHHDPSNARKCGGGSIMVQWRPCHPSHIRTTSENNNARFASSGGLSERTPRRSCASPARTVRRHHARILHEGRGATRLAPCVERSIGTDRQRVIGGTAPLGVRTHHERSRTSRFGSLRGQRSTRQSIVEMSNAVRAKCAESRKQKPTTMTTRSRLMCDGFVPRATGNFTSPMET